MLDVIRTAGSGVREGCFRSPPVSFLIWIRAWAGPWLGVDPAGLDKLRRDPLHP